jgi:hypothetical protein
VGTDELYRAERALLQALKRHDLDKVALRSSTTS